MYVYVLGELISKEEEIPNIYEFLKIYYPRIFARLGNFGNVPYVNIIQRIKAFQGVLNYNTTKMFDQNKFYMNNITAFNNIPIESQSVTEGITKLWITYNNSFNSVFPMQYIFKSIHATELFPCIKYCKYRRGEQLFRLYQVDNIPVVSKSSIIKLMNTVGKLPGISSIVSMANYAYINNINLNIVSDVMIIIHMQPNGNINVYYDTTPKGVIKYDVLISILRSIMGLFSAVINNTILTHTPSLPTEYPHLTGTEITVLSLEMSAIYMNIKLSTIIQKSQYIPACFSIYSLNKNPSETAKHIEPYIILYTRTNAYVPDSLESTYISILPDKLTRGVIFTIYNIPSILYIPVLSGYISKFVTMLTNKDIFANYKASCIPGYNTYIHIQPSIEDQENPDMFQTENNTTTTFIPMSTMYSALDTSSDDTPDVNSMENVLRTIEDMLLERKEQTQHIQAYTIKDSPTLISSPLEKTMTDPDIDDEDLDMDFGDMGW